MDLFRNEKTIIDPHYQPRSKLSYFHLISCPHTISFEIDMIISSFYYNNFDTLPNFDALSNFDRIQSESHTNTELYLSSLLILEEFLKIFLTS